MKKVIFALTVLVLASLACSTLTNVPGGTSPTTPAQTGKSILYKDDFSSSSSGWPVASDADKAANYTADGQYQIQAITKEQDVWAHPGVTFSDVSIEVDATKASGTDNNGFGVVCRFVDDNNFYFFMVSSDGYQVIGKYEGGKAKYLSSDKMQAASGINAGNVTNHVRGDCVGSTLTLYVNGKQLSSVTDTSFTTGDVGLIVGTFEDPNVSVNFDNFVVYQP